MNKEEVEVIINAGDFEGNSYTQSYDCPFARACKRAIPNTSHVTMRAVRDFFHSLLGTSEDGYTVSDYDADYLLAKEAKFDPSVEVRRVTVELVH